MNQEIKAKWVAALRSGEYAQGEGYLKDLQGRHCCLGVLCEISAAETGFGIPENLSETTQDEYLGYTVKEWAGLENCHGALVCIDGAQHNLTIHNDNGKTFLEIADAIEEQL